MLKDVPYEETAERAYGNKVHKLMERRINYNEALTGDFLVYESFIPIGFKLMAELELGINERGAPVEFFAKDVWLRGKIDCVVLRGGDRTGVLLDWKTGKQREDPNELKIQALLVKRHMPFLDHIFGHYVWLKDGKVGRRHDVSDTNGTFARVRQEVDEIFHGLTMQHMPPKQSGLCPFCPVKSCEFHP